MLRILDRYVLREIGPSFAIGVGVFTFVLLLNEILRFAQMLIAQGASLGHVLAVLGNLLPSVLCLTIPMGVLLGILIALGRMAADSEIVAMRASGISLYLLLRPILLAAAIGWAASSYLIIHVLPDSNQAVRQLLFQILTSKAETDIRPRVFYDRLFPSLMFLVLDMPGGTDTWRNVFLADLTDPGAPRLTLASEGRLLVDSEKRAVSFYLKHGEAHQVTYAEPAHYDRQIFAETVLPLQAESFFPPDGVDVPRGAREMKLGQLAATYRETGLPVYLVEIHKKFSIPFACFVFALLGLVLGIHNRREGRSWGFVVAIGIIFVYYVFIQIGEGMGKQGRLSPLLSMWSANLVLGGAGLALLVRNARQAFLRPGPPAGNSTAGLALLGSFGGLVAGRAARRMRPADRPVVVIRVPRPVLRFPNTLDRYIAVEFFRYFFLVLAALVVIYVLGIMVDVIEEAFVHKIKGKVVFAYLQAALPQILFHMLPLATLMAALVNFAIFSKANELVAIKAGGISLYRISVPVILLGLGASVVSFGIQEYILPYSNRRAAELLDEIKRRPVETHNLLDRRWMLGGEQQIYHYNYYDSERQIFNGLAVYRYEPGSFSLSRRVYAERARWDPERRTWIFRKGWMRDFAAQGEIERFQKLEIDWMEPPEYFVKEEKQSDQMTYLELARYISDLRQAGFDVLRLDVALHSKISFPLAALLTILIGIPFSFTPGKKGALYGIGIAIVIGLAYYVTTRIFASMGDSAMLPPLLAAWAPTVLFGIAAVYGLFNVRT